MLQESIEVFANNSTGRYVNAVPSNINTNVQKWKAVDVGSGYFRFESKSSNKAVTESLEVFSENADGRYVISIPTNTGWNSQKWRSIDVGGGYHRLQNKLSGKMLTYSNEVFGGNSDARYVIARTLNTSWDSQKWTIDLSN